ncbi:MAG: glycine zipper domain-containing protein [Thermodesulfobacteriota bacterium]
MTRFRFDRLGNAAAGLTLALVLSLGLLVSGCATKAQSGAGIGALAGAVVGSQLGPSGNRGENAIIGAALGAFLGYAIGNEMDKYDRTQLNQVYETGRSNTTTKWVNPDTGNRYRVTPKAAYKGPEGRPCREARIDATVNGKPETVVSTACRASDGMWELQK